MLPLLIATLAVFGIWEFLLVVVPWTIPPWLQPILVYAAALAFCWPDWRLALAVMGGVGICHVLVRNVGGTAMPAPSQVVQRPSRLPKLP